MFVNISPSSVEAGQAAARQAAQTLRTALKQQGSARLVLATGASQFNLLANLVTAPDLNWSQVTCFHLDEYIGLPASHPASFRKYLQERFASLVPVKVFNFIAGDAPDSQAECSRLGALLRQAPIDLALVGIGENGHLAFNDPPADFEVDEAYIIVRLDEACRRQQVGEGWFPNLQAVPGRAVSMTIRQIMRCRQVICTVPDLRKAAAVQCSLEGPVSPDCPASILQQHPDCHFFLDEAAASRLSTRR
jgi:glucosamine-6-phosphate deaminase